MVDTPSILGVPLNPDSVGPQDIDDIITDESQIKKTDLDEQRKFQSVVQYIRTRYEQSDIARQPIEHIWLEAYRMYRGEHSPEERARIDRIKQRNPYASEIFLKITKTKTLAAYGQILDILFAENKFPLGVEATPVPEGIAKTAHLEPDSMPDMTGEDVHGYDGDGKEITPGSTGRSLFNGLWEKYSKFAKGKKAVDGPSPDPKQFVEVHPADEAADQMERVILDQLSEGGAELVLRQAALEACILGTGVIKGPFTVDETIHSWELAEGSDELTYTPKSKRMPKIAWTSCWNFYPESYSNQLTECEFTIERHLLAPNKVRALKSRPDFDKKAIDRLLLKPAKYTPKYWENTIRDSQQQYTDTRYEILEYWGFLDKEMLEGFDIDKKELEKFTDIAQVNIWVSPDYSEILKLVINPFVPARIPYYAVPYEELSYQIWGNGIPENMKDPQNLMNGHMRMAINNLSFAGNTILEVNENQLVPGQDMSLYPGKIFRKQGGAPGQSLYGITIPNVAPAHIEMMDKARQLADEATGQPSYSYGQTGIGGAGKTASGISMLMGAASLNVKTVIKNFDNYLLTPLGEAYYFWNMQFNNKDLQARGDLKIVAKGTASLMQREVQSQRLLQFLQVTQGPTTAPFVNVEYLIKQFAKSLGLDPDKAVNDPEMAMLYADILGKMGQAQQGPQPGMEGQPPSAEGPPPPSDETGGGGGNIGVGAQPGPGNQQFSSNQ